MPVFQTLVGAGNVAYVENGTNVISGAPLINVAGIPVGSWVARKGASGWEFPTDAQMFALGEAASPIGIDPTALALTGNNVSYNFATYRKVKTAVPAAAATILAATINAVQTKWIGGCSIIFPMGATAYAINMPSATSMVEHGRPSTWTANQDYIALIVKHDVPHLFWLAPGVRLS